MNKTKIQTQGTAASFVSIDIQHRTVAEAKAIDLAVPPFATSTNSKYLSKN